MAALVAGVQYGLSSHSNFDENKSLIFVKLTDSAQRAIEDYLRNRNKINQNPTIQFLGNEGQLSFPSTKSSHGNFTFSLSSNQDIEGPQGGFECVQQTGPKNLVSLGALPCKMRIHANDDVYETTRHRMHVAEENNKNKCTRVIKANEPIGRKVKVKGTVRNVPPPVNANVNTGTRYRESSTPSTLTHQIAKPLYPSKSTSNFTANRPVPEAQKKLTEIMRRPLKERLIHLLALRPFKRPELYDRISREGIREKEKNVITTVLKQIAFMRDNTYHLQRCVWNDVHEDWPFYTEQEKTVLKRRKPQNLTPPGSSDGGSSGSGQSPNSTHPGSPPVITAPPPGTCSGKRPGYYQGNDGLPTKRQRISHYRKPDFNCSTNVGESGRSNSSSTNSPDQKNRQNQQRHQQLQYKHATNSSKSSLTPTSDSEENNTNTFTDLNKPMSNINSNEFVCNETGDKHYSQQYSEQDQQKSSNFNIQKAENSENNNSDTHLVDSDAFHNIQVVSPRQMIAEVNSDYNDCKTNDEEENKLSEVDCPSSSKNAKSANNFESCVIGDTLLPFSTSSCKRILSTSTDNFKAVEYPDYLLHYTTISSAEQRTHYKAEFNTYYTEYRKLHKQVVAISQQFSHLEEELREKLENGNKEGYEAIKNQILQEYAKTKNVNARFYYLHEKLGHIKKLVSEYDLQLQSMSDAYQNNNQMHASLDLSDETLHPDLKEMQSTLPSLTAEQSMICSTTVSHTS